MPPALRNSRPASLPTSPSYCRAMIRPSSATLLSGKTSTAPLPGCTMPRLWYVYTCIYMSRPYVGIGVYIRLWGLLGVFACACFASFLCIFLHFCLSQYSIVLYAHGCLCTMQYICIVNANITGPCLMLLCLVSHSHSPWPAL